ncbi:MAG: recombinase family protein [Alphaproteobacteria bacterium]|nr:recombinase family protein [Alphaproteobacteria bacterium]
MNIKYAHVSSSEQGLDLQIEKLHAFSCEKIFQEKNPEHLPVTGKPFYKTALKFCREGDTLVITTLDRLARSMFDLHKIVAILERKQVDLVSA